MTRRTRATLFFVLGAIFLLGSPTIILYSQGYRWNWEEKWFSQVGAFYFQVMPTRADVFINEKSIGKTARVLGTLFTKNLAPATYRVQIQKEGYHAWEKQLEISAKQVTEAKHILLLPQNPTFVTLANQIQALWFASHTTEAIIQKSNAVARNQTTWTLSLWDSKKNTEYPLYLAPRSTDQVWEITWAQNSNAVLLRIVSQEQVQSFVQKLDRTLLERPQTDEESLQTAAQLRTSLDQLTSRTQHISFSPFHKDQLLYLLPTENSFVLGQFDWQEKKILPSLAQDVITFYAGENQITWLDHKGNLWQQKDASTPPLQLNFRSFPLHPETLYALHVFENEVFVQENQTLYHLNLQTKEFDEFLSPFQEIVLSPDRKKLAISTGKEIWLLYAQEEQEQPLRTKGEKVFLTRFSEDIAQLVWFDSYHLVFTKKDTIMVSEIDNRDRLNMVELATFSKPNFFWQDITKTLLVHSNSQVKISETLLP